MMNFVVNQNSIQMAWKTALTETLSEKYKSTIEIDDISAVSGGSINETFTISTNTGKFFVKKNSASLYPEMFEKEAWGLQILSEKSLLKVPEVIATGQSENTAFLILEHIESGKRGSGFWDRFAKGLAQLHKNSADYFGLDHDNYIGSLHQSNVKHDNWIDFFRTERLEKQVKLARDNGRMGKAVVSSFENFYRKLPDIFPNEPPRSSMAIYGVEIIWSTEMEKQRSLIRPCITVTGKWIWECRNCLVVLTANCMKPINDISHLKKVGRCGWIIVICIP
jgi:fructosamine-3-kinase